MQHTSDTFRLFFVCAARRHTLWPGLLVLGLSSAAVGKVLYSVDFESPVHVPGEPPARTQGPAPRNAPTDCLVPVPLVLAPAGVLDGQSLWFDSSPNNWTYVQAEFSLADEVAGFSQFYDVYRFDMDIVSKTSLDEGSFRIFFDGPVAHQVYFSRGRFGVITLGDAGYHQELGELIPGQRMSLKVRIDRAAEQWSIGLNGSPLFHGDFPLYTNPSGGMNAMRFAGERQINVYVDNVRISGLPEPATAALLGGALAFLARRERPLRRRGHRPG